MFGSEVFKNPTFIAAVLAAAFIAVIALLITAIVRQNSIDKKVDAMVRRMGIQNVGEYSKAAELQSDVVKLQGKISEFESKCKKHSGYTDGVDGVVDNLKASLEGQKWKDNLHIGKDFMKKQKAARENRRIVSEYDGLIRESGRLAQEYNSLVLKQNESSQDGKSKAVKFNTIEGCKGALETMSGCLERILKDKDPSQRLTETMVIKGHGMSGGVA